MRFDTLFRFILQGGVGGMEGQVESKDGLLGPTVRGKGGRDPEAWRLRRNLHANHTLMNLKDELRGKGYT